MSLGSRQYPAAAQSVGAARRFAVHVLQELALEHLHDDVRTVVSELATNAVLHARTPFTITVTLHERSLRIAVADQSQTRPRPSRLREQTATTGRGLRIVADLSTAWGIEIADASKVVWCDLPLDPPLPARHTDPATAVGAHPDSGPGAAVGDELVADVDVDALLDAYDDTDPTPPALRVARAVHTPQQATPPVRRSSSAPTSAHP